MQHPGLIPSMRVGDGERNEKGQGKDRKPFLEEYIYVHQCVNMYTLRINVVVYTCTHLCVCWYVHIMYKCAYMYTPCVC